MYTQLIDGLWLGMVVEEAYDEATCRQVMRDWLCDVFGEDREKHSIVPPFDVAALREELSL